MSSSMVDDPVLDISNDYASVEKQPFNADQNKRPSIYFFAVRLTTGEYNVFVIFISVLLISWLLRSLRKFFRMLRVRSSLRNGTLIFIRGVGSSLRIFDGITLNHSSSILNTRQANPPSLVPSLVMPFTIKDIKLISNKVFSLELITSVPCVIWVVGNFHVNAYKDVYQNNAINNAVDFVEELGKVRRTSSSTSSSSVLDGTNTSNSNSIEEGYETIDDSGKVRINSLGYHRLTLNLPKAATTISTTTAAAARHVTSSDTVDIESNDIGIELSTRSDDNNTIGVFIYPLGQIEENLYTTPTTTTITSATATATRTTTNNDNNNNNNNNNNRNNVLPTTNDISSIMSNDNFTRFDYAIQTISYDNTTKVLTPSDLLIFDNSKTMYSAMEIYGGNSSSSASASANANSSINANNTNNNNDNNDTDDSNIVSNPLTVSTSLPSKVKEDDKVDSHNVASDECVICLTEALQVILMPCRHMCVCKDCLVFIDRCPVCRSTFDQHLVINKDFKIIKQKGNTSNSCL